MNKQQVIIISFVGVIIFLVIGLGPQLWSSFQNRNVDPRERCVQHGEALSMHIHPNLEINIEGKPVEIPANIGITDTCMKPVHTHDTTGKIHIEYPGQHNFQLRDFFANWQQPFSSTQILDHTVDANHVLTMTVDGQPSTEFENLIMKDGQKIVITYVSKQSNK